MRATGIIRRIDPLGRVVIPKEICRAMGLNEGDPIEIFLEGKDTVCFRKYNTNLCDEVDNLKYQIENFSGVPYETQERIIILLNEVRKLIKDEE